MGEKMKLIVIIPHDENYQMVQETLVSYSYKKEYWRAFIPPNRIKYEFNGLNEKGVENFKSFFREVYADSKYKSLCSFEVIE